MSFTKRLPKLELHAHLSGSISSKVLSQFLSTEDANYQIILAALEKGKFRDIYDCLAIFANIHTIVKSYEILHQVTKAVVRDFYDDGVIYLELRSTPCSFYSFEKIPLAVGYRTYMETVMQAIEEICSELEQKIIVRLLVSVDRRLTRQEVDTLVDVTLQVKQEHKLGQKLICGMDLCSYPKAGDLSSFLPGLQKARANGLPLTLHLAEVIDQSVEELTQLLQLPASRIGHATFLHTHYPQLLDLVDQLGIVIELCLTSNIKCRSVCEYEKHHLHFWWNRPGSKLCICTDDKGVFECNLSEELDLTADLLKLSEADLWRVQQQTVDYAFCDEECKNLLRQRLNQWKDENLSIKEQ